MAHTPEEIYNALTVLKEICQQARFCKDCPLVGSKEICAIDGKEFPGEWHINPINEWKAF